MSSNLAKEKKYHFSHILYLILKQVSSRHCSEEKVCITSVSADGFRCEYSTTIGYSVLKFLET